ncbi:MAG: ParB/RepB/Spo0J family partition protein [Thermoanaerobaculaceae bacterium]
MSSRKGLPDFRKMRHDRHFVEELANQSIAAIGMMIPVEKIETNREQPRSNLGDVSELAQSIRARGILEPLLVRPMPGTKNYQLIAGERRFHAAIEAGLEEVPCVEIPATDQEALELALVENLQRRDLSPFEEAEGYRTLTEKYAYTHDQVASGIGKSRTTVTETLKLLAIPPAIQDLCRHADITAKSVLLLIARARTIQEMEKLVQEIAEGNLDREAARLAAQGSRAERGDTTPVSAGDNQRSAASGQGRFRPLRIRLQTTPSAPIRLSLSIREPGVTRHEVIATLEAVLEQLRSGELDDRLVSPSEESDEAP